MVICATCVILEYKYVNCGWSLIQMVRETLRLALLLHFNRVSEIIIHCSRKCSYDVNEERVK